VGRVFAALYDRMMAGAENAGLRALRAELLADARGEVLELGAGTGLNVPHYSRERVTRLVVSEPDPHMAARLRAKEPDAEVVEAPAERLPFADAGFDTVVATLMLCTVDDPGAAVAEVARVLRPGGRLLFLEHVRSGDARLARWQDRLERPWGWVGAGCHPNRDTLATLRASPLRVDAVREARFPKSPPIVRPMIVGAAVRP
jgi:ubiquinone/menaquinone biosynthesis C-methylase UbiE